MLSSDENNGLFAFVFGLVVLVFAGVALSLLVDRRFNFSSSVKALEAEVSSNESELERLRKLHQEYTWNLSDIEPERKMDAASLMDLNKSIDELMRRREALVCERESLEVSIPALEQEFANYRRKYREKVRDAAVGEFLGTFVIPSGREYREAYISRITDVGLEIRHAHGTARISAMESGSALQKRFKWDEEESQARLREEQKAISEMEKVTAVAPRPEKPQLNPVEAAADPQKIQILRSKVIAWRSRISLLQNERYRALSASYGSQASPPGSLETWQAMAARLAGEIARAEAELRAAKTDLAAVSPHDTLLRSYAGSR